MNNKLICPFCQQEYIITKDDSCFGQQRCVCRNPNCEFDGWHFPVKLVSELIRTRKELDDILGKHEKLLNNIAMRANREQELRNKLDIAVDALKDMNEIIKDYEYGNGLYYALDGHDTRLIAEDVEKALEQITALEQKDVK